MFKSFIVSKTTQNKFSIYSFISTGLKYSIINISGIKAKQEIMHREWVRTQISWDILQREWVRTENSWDIMPCRFVRTINYWDILFCGINQEKRFWICITLSFVNQLTDLSRRDNMFIKNEPATNPIRLRSNFFWLINFYKYPTSLRSFSFRYKLIKPDHIIEKWFLWGGWVRNLYWWDNLLMEFAIKQSGAGKYAKLFFLKPYLIIWIEPKKSGSFICSVNVGERTGLSF